MTTPADPAARAAPLPRGDATPEMRLQILTAEHASLVSSRSLAWSESFTRAGMFLSTLSFAMVAIALVAQASNFGEPFRLFALALLPALIFLGVGTMLRLDNANYHDVVCIVGMNRIRAMYVRLAPDLDPVFVMGTTDDLGGIQKTMGNLPTRSLLAAIVSSTPVQLAVVNGLLVAAMAALLLVHLGAATAVGLVGGALAFVGAMGIFDWYSRRQLDAAIRTHHPLVPGRPSPVEGAAAE